MSTSDGHQLSAGGGFSYRTVKLYRDKPLGSGSYGSVCRALCDELPCAAKILHPIFFSIRDPASQNLMQRFQQECDVMSSIRHPNIVQCLCTHHDPDLRGPVLLMELMDDSLTHFLERSRDPLPYHTQLNFAHDIALALAYLHACGVIHRDLSSNNVLLIAGSRAKVTDFGMSKLIDVNSRMTPLTQCPGMGVYMSPEAMRTPPVYTNKLDCFSFGVLVVQILTRQFPIPTAARNTISDPQYPTGKIEVPVPEVKRRQKHINLIETSHPLLPVALECLKDEERERPQASDLCFKLQELKEQERYNDSLEQEDTCLPSTQTPSEAERDEVKRSDSVAAQQQEIETAQREEIESLKTKLHEAQDKVSHLQHLLQEKDAKFEKLQEELQAVKSREPRKHTSLEESGTIASLRWRRGPNAPCEMGRGAVCTNADRTIAYFNPVGTSQIYSFTVQEEKWACVEPLSPNELFGLAVVAGDLTTIGGLKDGEVKAELLTLSEGSSGSSWKQKYPPMPTKRLSVAVATHEQYLITAGGKSTFLGSSKVATVEVLDCENRQWFTAASLCDPMSGMSIAVCGQELYVAGGTEYPQKSVGFVLNCPLPALIKSFKRSQSRKAKKASDLSSSIWHRVSGPSIEASTYITICGQLLAVAFHAEVLAEKTIICMYNRKSDTWVNISKVPTARSRSLCAAVSGDRLIVVGGYRHSTSSFTDITEIATPE